MADSHLGKADHQSDTDSSSHVESSIAENLKEVRSRIHRAAIQVGRDPAEVQLVAVSKTFSADHIRAAVTAGQVDFGENRVQEGLQKCATLRDLNIRWHLIGHLQSNKTKKIVEPFAWIHSVDSADLLKRVNRIAVEKAARLEVLIQVDLAGEATKHGATPEELPDILTTGLECQAAQIRGLMLMPPLDEPERVRPYFRRLYDLRNDLLGKGFDSRMLHHLSMGMSHDFEVAVQEGATIVRVGSAIFGTRSPKKNNVPHR